MNLYAGSNDVLYWLFDNSHQISKEKLEFTSELLVFLLFAEV